MTRKEILNNFKNVYAVGYCDLQFLLRFKNKIGYNAGVYGWNYDTYVIGDNVAICTGYRGMPGKSIDYDIVRKYNEKARNIVSNWDLTIEQQKKKIDNLINKFLEEIKQ